MDTATIRVFVADSTRMYTQLLADALRRDPQLHVTAPISKGRVIQEVREAAENRTLDVVVLGCNLEEEPLGGIRLLAELRVIEPAMKAVILLDSSKREVVLEAFRTGARGLLSRDESLENLCKCVHQVHAGQIWANSEHVRFAVEALAASPGVRAVDVNGLELLSKREVEVVGCLAEGLTNKEIAERLKLSQHTIKNYLFRIFDKLGVSSRTELLSLTLRHSLPKSVATG
jgi:DNA-binding NarL/FixJ family response regulator